MSNKIIQKSSLLRLINDIKNIYKNPLNDNGIYYKHDEVDMLKGYAMIVGPIETPYFGGFYLFEFNFPTDYPHSPPILTYLTNDGQTRFNPNLYTNGKVCVSILNTWTGDQWSSCQTITSILLTLCTLFNNEPLLNEPGVNKDHYDFKKYNKIIYYKNISIAICGMIKEKYLPSKFFCFIEDIKSIFLKNYSFLLEFINTKIIETLNKSELVYIHLYRLKILIDYDVLKTELLDCYDLIKNKKINCK